MKKAIKVTTLIAVLILLCGAVVFGLVKYRDNITYRTIIVLSVYFTLLFLWLGIDEGGHH